MRKRTFIPYWWAVSKKYVRRDDHGSYGHSLGHTNQSSSSSPVQSPHNIPQSTLHEVPQEAISSQPASKMNHNMSPVSCQLSAQHLNPGNLPPQEDLRPLVCQWRRDSAYKSSLHSGSTVGLIGSVCSLQSSQRCSNMRAISVIVSATTIRIRSSA